ncbi:MFS transporter [Microbacterium kyungheense]|uniref:FSR family fosmidomycin resistance protein-like MFS transporter n=1 Tax=Microbacterium kyungheense TaxID=1263636 RepID=A0A543EF97_9MICO|nr:MFS transporter [Microbacterium kyungheense]TQM20258.1 FSR family fosmidomycin resistance protein-like MFS transporter [Microbacterium kyungheense]
MVSASSVPSPRRALFWSLVGTHLMNDFQTGAAAALLPYFVLEQHYDYAAVAGLTLAATSLSSVFQPVFGWLTDRFALRPLIVVGLAVAALGIAVAGLTSANYWLTWIVFSLSGLGVAAYHPAATVAAKEAGGGTNRSMSIFSVGGNVGAAIAPIGVGVTVGILGLRATPLLLIPTIAVAAVYLVLNRRAALRPTGASTSASAAGSETSASAAGSVETAAAASTPGPRDLWSRFAWLLLIVSLWSVAYVGARSFVALDVIDRFRTTTDVGNVALTVFSAAAALGTLVGGFFADRFGRIRVIVLGYALATAAAVGYVFAATDVTAIVLAGVLGWALFLPFALHVTLSHAYLPRHLGTASGVTLGMATALGGLLTPLLGVLADAVDPRAVFVVIAAVIAAALVCSLFLRERTDLGEDVDASTPAAAAPEASGSRV